MAATISRKLSNSFEGALAGGGDPASSPLYVFGPFLKLIVIAGVAKITFGASIWLVVFTVLMVSAMYRQVMTWITDGSGGSGLAEEEFGGWAVKINAGITVIEYTLTFLVSMAALVTLLADRAIEFGVPLGDSLFGIPEGYKLLVAIAVSVFTGWLVNRGPKVAARAFGPATMAVLILLWVMIFATIYKFWGVPMSKEASWLVGGINIPAINLEAFSTENLHFTLGGYARILALMTGIEIFANLVAAYEGKRAERSRKAFGSLVIIMGTTALTMIIVGPAILEVSQVTAGGGGHGGGEASVFTQTMNQLLPTWASYLGTIAGVAVLLSASAAATQGIQNLALGLRYRHYVAADIGQRNKFDVADKPVWIMIAVIALCYILFGTHEETYLALYAAGVFILLSMTGWAACKRLLRNVREQASFGRYASLAGTAIASLLTTVATAIIFQERFFEGAWLYFVLVPGLYFVFSYYRKKLGEPPSVEDRLGSVISEQRYLPVVLQETDPDKISFKKIVVPLNGTSLAEQVLATSRSFARSFDAELEIIAVEDDKHKQINEEYLEMVSGLISGDGLHSDYDLRSGDPATEIDRFAVETNSDLIIMTTRGKFTVGDIIADSVAQRVIKKTLTPTLLIRPTDDWRSRRSKFQNILVALDGSEPSEKVLPYVRTFYNKFGGKILLLSVPEGSESDEFAETMKQYLDDIAEALIEEGMDVRTMVTGSGPARTIVSLSEDEGIDLIMMASHGRGGISRSAIHLGSVTDRVVQKTPCPMFILPLTRSQK